MLQRYGAYNTCPLPREENRPARIQYMSLRIAENLPIYWLNVEKLLEPLAIQNRKSARVLMRILDDLDFAGSRHFPTVISW